MRRILSLSILFLCLYSHHAFAVPGVVVVAGGGPEGELDEKEAWSYSLYKRLIDNGSIHGNNKIKVVVVSLDEGSTFIGEYLTRMGATSAESITVNSKAAANDPKIVGTLADADVVFFRGGNQGDAYRFWKGSLLHQYVNKIAENGGAIGGTSSGAMGLSEYSMTGGQDFNSSDLLKNSHSPLLNDETEKDKSGIHNDFLNLIPGVIVDTHCAQRARLGRLMAVHGKASEDYDKKDIVGICLEEKTGIAISNGKAEVYGTGLAHFIQQTPETVLKREGTKPLVYTNMRDDALTEHWVYDLKTNRPIEDQAPSSSRPISKSSECGSVTKDEKISSNKDVHKIEYSVNPAKKNFVIKKYNQASVKNVVAIYDAYETNYRAENQTNALRALYDLPNSSVLLLPAQTEISGEQNSDSLSFNHRSKKGDEISTLILDCSTCTQKSLSSYVSSQDAGNMTLHSAGFVNLRIHALASGNSYNIRNHQIQDLADDQFVLNNRCTSSDLTSSPFNLNEFLPVLKKLEICNP